MIWVTAEDVILIHSRIIQTTGGIEGLRDRAGLEAAIVRHYSPLAEKISFQVTLRRLQESALVWHRTMRFSMVINASAP